MQTPNNGALGLAYTSARLLQSISLITIIGLVSNFISQMVSASTTPPSVLIGTLVISILALLYIVIAHVLYIDLVLNFLYVVALDSLLLIAVIVVAVTVGKPLSYLNCQALGSNGDAKNFLDSVGANVEKLNYWIWAGAGKTICLEMKAVWGLSIALCILFFLSLVVSGLLWNRERMARQGLKSVV